MLIIDSSHISLKHLVDHLLLLFHFIVLWDIYLDHVLSQLDETLVLFIALYDHLKIDIIVLVVSFKQVLHDYFLASEQDSSSDILLKSLIIDESSFFLGKSESHLLLKGQLFISNILNRNQYLLMYHLELVDLVVNVDPREYIIVLLMLFYDLVWFRDLKTVIFKGLIDI